MFQQLLFFMINFRQATINDLQTIIDIISENVLGSTKENLQNIAPYADAFQKISQSPDMFLQQCTRLITQKQNL